MKKEFFALLLCLVLLMKHSTFSSEETEQNTNSTLHQYLLLHDDAEEKTHGFCTPLSNLLTCNGSRYAQHTCRKVLKSALLCYLCHYSYSTLQKEKGICSSVIQASASDKYNSDQVQLTLTDMIIRGADIMCRYTQQFHSNVFFDLSFSHLPYGDVLTILCLLPIFYYSGAV